MIIDIKICISECMRLPTLQYHYIVQTISPINSDAGYVKEFIFIKHLNDFQLCPQKYIQVRIICNHFER